ncbi:hypothetical protein N7533_011470 [Penicillium manginii]|uniref:uncharacterized protein n=1 Tax=Penicillium manginii TaxID=203109 RepID=UPI002548369E|nr:uncharacterized protein N7533_011470 [Penicillium manginii]KAJ5742061.1 hypothetical protein N7533_011470 [Penicillium manginii]
MRVYWASMSNTLFVMLTSVLAGRSARPFLPRFSIVLKDNDQSLETSDIKLSTSISPAKLAQLQLETVLVGWKPLIRAGIKQTFSSSQQVQSSYRVSSSVINNFRLQAMENGQRVTLNDLLMAFIWKASTASQSWKQDSSHQRYPAFSFVLNIRRQIKQDTDLHNPWVIVQVPKPPHNSSLGVKNIIDLAAHIRETIRHARTTDCLRPIIDHHKRSLGKPLMLDTELLVTSWSHICLYKTDFQLGKNPTIQPEYVQPFVRMPGLFRKLGMRIENTVVTSQDGNGGFWIHGNLEEVVWGSLASITSLIE